MTGASKILTVSYGTFSCTLEGFDDPFNTMKAIAEYFRDLAAGDRYFGAEPPVPDAAMLHQIAEREIHRRVEAKIQENGVILRAGEAALAAPSDAETRPGLHDDARDTAAESVAARLQRIRSKHSAPAATVERETLRSEADLDATDLASYAAVAEPAQPDAYTEDQHADESEAESAAHATGHATVHPTAFADAGLGQASVPVIEVSDQLEEILDEAENGAAIIAQDTPVASVITEQAVEADAAAELAAEAAILAGLASDLPEDVSPEDVLPEDISLEDISGNSLEDSSWFDAAEALDQAGDVDPDADDLDADDLDADDLDADDLDADEAGLLARLGAAEPAIPAQTEAHSADAAAKDDALLASLGALIDPEEDMIEDIDQGTQDQATQDQAETPAQAAASVAEPAPAAPMTAQPAAAPRARARVIRIHRSNAPAAAPVATPVAAPAPASVLSDEAEAALQAELAALEAELAPPEAMEPAPILAPALAPVAAQAVEPRKLIVQPAEDDAVNRLMAQANSEMDDESNRRRQSAIAHLKAAVAATEADRKANAPASAPAEQRMETYRNDLDRVVRPRRPATDAVAPRPAAPEPVAPAEPAAPLVLVSEQRIDRTQPVETAEPVAAAAPRLVQPVRPRRIIVANSVAPAGGHAIAETSAHSVIANRDQFDAEEEAMLDADLGGNVFADATSFEDFADQLGASALPDLLEAAAVYCAEVLQRPEFSRPLVMRQIAAIPGQTATSREDYLRGFGTLLRQGRITKVKRGMFALTDRSPYLAEARKIAG